MDLLRDSAKLANSLGAFCRELQKENPALLSFSLLLPQMGKRLQFGVPQELVPLMEIKGVKQGMARSLAAAGYASLAKIATATENDLISHVQFLSRNAAKQIISHAKGKVELLEQIFDDES